MAELTTTIPAYFPILDGKGHWVSQEGLGIYSSEQDMDIMIPAGAKNDLASIPFMFRTLFPVNGTHRLAAAIHDYLYEKKGKLPGHTLMTRKQADDIFLEFMLIPRNKVRDAYVWDAIRPSDKPTVPRWRAYLMYLAVRAGGWIYWNKKPK